MVPEFSPLTLWKLYKHFGSPERIIEASEHEILKNFRIRKKTLEALEKQKRKDPLLELERLEKMSISFITYEDKNYPPPLKYIEFPPLCLFMKGSYKPEDLLAIAIVGTRKPSNRGLLLAERFAFELASLGITVVSGLAVGVDTASHRGAIKARGRTIAVMGSGLDIVYPRANRKLMEEIAEKGVLVSEYPPGSLPEKWRFPLRNRIISGLSMGVLVVEAGLKSGALITAKFAIEQGREVFAIPGGISDYRYQGSNRLIKEGAKLVEKIEDILEEFHELRTLVRSSVQPGAEPKGLSQKELIVFRILKEEPQHIDVICDKAKLPCSEALSILTTMEIKGLVRQLPGKYFVVERL